MIASVAVTLRVRQADKLYDYRVPEQMELRVGQCVEVPFGRRVAEGYVLGLKPADEERADSALLREVLRDLDAGVPRLTAELVELVSFLRERYLCTWGAAIQTVVPPVARTREEARYLPGPQSERLPVALREHLARRGGVTHGSLMARFAASPGTVRNWLADESLVPARARVLRMRARTERFLALSPDPPADPPRGVKAQAVLRALTEAGGPVRATDLAQTAGVGRTMIAALVKKGFLVALEREIDRISEEQSATGLDTPPVALTAGQNQALARVLQACANGRSEVLLLRGVTGSGKTEVYLRAIERMLAAGRTAIMLVPEIALTTQMTARVKARLGASVAVLHSNLSDREKHDEWRRIAGGEARVVVGARSAVFAPVVNLGLLVVDEEHETTYKQENEPRYVTREVAERRARHWGAPLVLGSATPSLDAMYRAERGRYTLLDMPERVGRRPLSQVQIVDLRHEFRSGNRSLFSRTLRSALEGTLARGEQAILFLNRRGYASVLLCRDCGDTVTCPSCDITLTVHRARGAILRCHMCGHAKPVPQTCPSCGSLRVRQFGAGTQRVEEELFETFPGVRVVRMDVDTTAARGAHQQMLSTFSAGEADILLGTQMIAKGLDFPRVSLAGVIMADHALRVPDFRAAERTFQLLVQVAGRAGRGDTAGLTVVQTFSPEHYAILHAARQDHEAFYRAELSARREMGYPPFTEIARFLVTHEREETAARVCAGLSARLKDAFAGDPDVRVLDSVPAPMKRIRAAYRYQTVVKYKSFRAAAQRLRTSLEQTVDEAGQGIGLTVDVNAHSLA